MSKQIEVVYENGVLRPDEPLDLKPNTRVRVTLDAVPDPERPRGTLRELFGSVDLGHPTGADNDRIDSRLELMKEASNDEMFMADLKATMEDFREADKLEHLP